MNKFIIISVFFAILLNACDNMTDPPDPDPEPPTFCETSPCKNGGSCNDFTESCECEAPYLGPKCETHYSDILEGTWANVSFAEEDRYHISIEKNGSKFTVRNISNRNGRFPAHLHEKTFTLEENKVMDYFCSDFARVAATEGVIEKDEEGYLLEIRVHDYQQNCQGRPALSYESGRRRFRKVSDSPCKAVWLNDQCISNPKSTVSGIGGTWSLNNIESQTEARWHSIKIAIIDNGARARIDNLFGNGKVITAHITHNLFIFTPSVLPTSYTIPNGARFTIHDNYLIGRIAHDGKTIRFEGKSSTPNIPWFITEKLVYKR